MIVSYITDNIRIIFIEGKKKKYHVVRLLGEQVT